MAHTLANSSAVISEEALGKLESGVTKATGLFEGLLHSWKVRSEKAKALRDLRQMNEYELHDLGINSGDFDNIVNGSFKRGE